MFGNTFKTIRKKCKKNKDYNNYTCNQTLTGYVCIICLNDLDKGQTMTLLKCDHIYHKHCIDEWFNKKRVCPVCDIEIKP